MENSFRYSFNEKRYHTFNYYLKTKYNCKVSKVILDAGFTCPNRDGSKGFGGCTFCSEKGSGDSNIDIGDELIKQYNANKAIMDNKWPNGLYIPYFQSFSNTYGPLEKIKNMLSPFIKMDEVCEIAIATRCDCLQDETIKYLDSLTSIKPIWLEIGLQTSNDKTGILVNRQYTFSDFKNALEKLSKTNIKVCVHIMNGLPYESKQDMLQTIEDIKNMKFDAIKIHMLHILKNTVLGNEYQKQPFDLISRDEYIELVVKQLELLKPEVIIQRLTGDPMVEDLLGPNWVTNKTTILNDIGKLMRKLDTYQGAHYEQ